MKHSLLNKRRQIIYSNNNRNKERKEPLKKANTITSVSETIQPKCFYTSRKKSNSKIKDDHSMNLIFTPIDKTKYSQLPKHEIEEEEEKKLITFLKTSIMHHSQSGQYEINTHELKLRKQPQHVLAHINDSQNKYEEYSNSSRYLLTSATTSQLSTGIIPKKIAKIKLDDKESNISPKRKYPSRMRTIPLNISRNTKMSISPRIKSNRLTTIQLKPSKNNKTQIDELIQRFFNQKGYKV